jgi:hypothetical protein
VVSAREPARGRHVASIRLDQSLLRRDQISVKLSSSSTFHRKVDRPDLAALSDTEIANWIPLVLSRGRRDRERRDTTLLAVIRWDHAFTFVDAQTHVFLRSVIPVLVC